MCDPLGEPSPDDAGMSHSPTISILTPVYNGENYLSECIESILNQTRQDWEYIIADNLSQDRSVEIAESYAARDSRIRVVRCDEFVNVHRSFSRCARLIDPNARYCKFVASDDWIYPECLERMVAIADAHPAVGVVSSYRLEGKLVNQDGLLPYTQTTMSGAEVVRYALRGGPFVTGSPSQLLYRADLVRTRQPFLDDTVWNSDSDAAYWALLQSDLGFVHQVLTFTRLHERSLTARFAHRVHTDKTPEIRMLLRYGRQVFSPEEYRAAMRLWLRRYAWWLLKQTAKPSRLFDDEYHAFHRSEINRMLDELHGDPESRMTLLALRTMLRNVKPAAATIRRSAGDECGTLPDPSVREISR
jgi:glycosyltransferase involved in cell wall biosynthesis